MDHFRQKKNAELIDLVKKEKYSQHMTLAGIEIGPLVNENNLPKNHHLFPIFNYLNKLSLADTICMNIGTCDGMTAFSLASRGAKRVDATCQYDLDRFRIARALGRYRNIAYYPKTDLDKIHSTFGPCQYDLVVMTAMLNQLLSPLEGLLEARRLLKKGGYFILEVVVRNSGPGSQISLNTALNDSVYDVSSIWIPTADNVMEMLRFSALNPVCRTHLIGGKNACESNYDRITVLSQAVNYDQIEDRTERLKEFHSTVDYVGRYRLADFCDSSVLDTKIKYVGVAGESFLSIWKHRPQDPLQPACENTLLDKETCFKLAEIHDFKELIKCNPDGAFTEEDLRFLSSLYTGQCMPEGMRWGLKQLGYLHLLNYIRKLGLEDIVEIGPGINMYFPYHLPDWCSYVALDNGGFYDNGLLEIVDKARKRGKRVKGLMGTGDHGLDCESFDACISVSVLEHVPNHHKDMFCEEMYDVLRPGGWALHSIDIQTDMLEKVGNDWLGALRNSGFYISDKSIFLDCRSPKKIFTEPLSIVMTFYHGYKKNIWDQPNTSPELLIASILVAAQKPYRSHSI
jgi:SAM-dependent methyltransferase